MNAIAQEITAYLEAARELHRRPADGNYAGHEAAREALQARHSKLLTASQDFWTLGKSFISAPDAYVQNLSERRSGSSRLTTFSLDALAYDQATRQEADGYQPVHFTIEGADKLRELNGKEIYEFVVSEADKAIGVLYHQPGQNMKLLVTEYASLQRTFGDFFTPPRRGMKP